VAVITAVILPRAVSCATALEVSVGRDAPFGERFMTNQDFSSALPMLLIDAEQNGDGEQKAVVSIHCEQEVNKFAKQPYSLLQVVITRDGDSGTKPNYKLKLSAKGKEKRSLLGMRPGDEWTLDGMRRDKSLLRTYLVYNAASVFMPETPQARYCEIFINEGNGYRYEGVYLLVENSFGGEGKSVPPGGEAEELRAVEEILYSGDAETYLEYRDYIDVDSFVNYYIFNEFFMNYNDSLGYAHIYKNSRGRFAIGPLGNFDEALDNSVYLAYQPEEFPLWNFFWYPALFKNTEFVERVIARRKELTRSVLSAANIEDMVDRTAAWIEGAQERNRLRWPDFYSGAEYALKDYVPPKDKLLHGIVATRRQTDNFNQEIIRIKYLLRSHGTYMTAALKTLIGKPDEMFGASDAYIRHSWMAVAFIAAFFFSVYAVRRYARKFQ
jgi:hypothetical protein